MRKHAKRWRTAWPRFIRWQQRHKSRLIEFEGIGVLQMAEVQDYFSLCLSSEYDYRLFLDFQSDSVVAIKDPSAFSIRLRKAIARHNEQHPNSRIRALYECPIIYVDPFLLEAPEKVSEVHFCKHFRFAYQTEFRYVLTPVRESELEPFFLDLGSLVDIADMVCAPEGATQTAAI